jgi:transcriptional antiterminator
MKNVRKYNNNIILANDQGQEVIVLGKGIGFQAHPGSPVDARLVEKVFVPQETAQLSRFADMPTTFKIVAITSDIIGIVKEHFHIAFDEESFDVMPFVLHLRNLALQYTVRPDQKAQNADEELYALVASRYPEASACCGRICAYLQDTHGWEPLRNDRMFLILHIKRIIESISR